MSPFRWNVAIVYRTEEGPEPFSFDIEDLEEVAEIVERGPHWDTVESITITRINPTIPGLTVEKAGVL